MPQLTLPVVLAMKSSTKALSSVVKLMLWYATAVRLLISAVSSIGVTSLCFSSNFLACCMKKISPFIACCIVFFFLLVDCFLWWSPTKPLNVWRHAKHGFIKLPACFVSFQEEIKRNVVILILCCQFDQQRPSSSCVIMINSFLISKDILLRRGLGNVKLYIDATSSSSSNNLFSGAKRLDYHHICNHFKPNTQTPRSLKKGNELGC